ncbi:hypothetical protein AK830_g2484 [Neonectria ditissima]|uniref:Xylanolytic transcriptional activator regulatory domain-containing protein n=1 Tax=Neonectria ditissima TaxID=78410 RepID=A0A0P7BB81_9HYPO|nr:hypothetical protein AK830_g2484 [Neonectria ditissima]
MHPILPILDEGDFWETYGQLPHWRMLNRRISLLLFQAMLFACCNYVPQTMLNQLGLKTARAARAAFYSRSKLLFSFDTESSAIEKSQAALLLASWSFSSYDIPQSPSLPWLSIAIQNARDADAHNYRAYDVQSGDYAVRKRLWWGCIIRDRILGLGMRRGIQITSAHFDVGQNNHLSRYDLDGELHRSLVHNLDTKIRLAEFLELLVELCVILTDILELAFPIENSLKSDGAQHKAQGRARNSQKALDRWHKKATARLPNFGTPSEMAKKHDSVVLYGNLVSMYYYLTKLALGHFRILQMATDGTESPTSPADIITLKHNHFELQEATIGTTECLEELVHLRLANWLPMTAVSCIALPLVLHILDVEILSSTATADSGRSKLMKHRLGILRKAMETYQLQYEGVDWICGAINRIINLARAGSKRSAEQSKFRRSQAPTNVNDCTGVLTFQPVWYLRLAFSIDVAFGKGRLPEDGVFLRSFRDVIVAEMSSSTNLLKQPANGDKRIQKYNGATTTHVPTSPRREETADDSCLAVDQEDNGQEMRSEQDATEGWKERGNPALYQNDIGPQSGGIMTRNEHQVSEELDRVALHCTYAGERRNRRWAGHEISERHFQMSVVRNPRSSTEEPARPAPETEPSASRSAASDESEAWQTPRGQRAPQGPLMDMELQSIEQFFSQMDTETNDTEANDTDVAVSEQTPSAVYHHDGLLDSILEGHDLECLKDTNQALWMRVSDGDEYTGPSSGISAISDTGLNWLRQNVADSAVLCETVQDIRNAVFNHLRHPKCMPQGVALAPLAPFSHTEITPSATRRYVDAYFSHVQVLFPILDRRQFLSQLSTFGTTNQGGRNYSWMALLNAVLACGCRAALSDETAEAFKVSGREAWVYFQNALSFESHIIHDATDLLAVQAMAVMTVFAQGLSSPQRLEYTFSSIASRLSHSLGLNRHPPPEWHLTEEEKRERNRVFWVVYCLDKIIALRCGRPSIISDDEISCCFPRGVEIAQQGRVTGDTSDSPMPLDLFLCFTKLSRICGNVSRRLYSATALHTPSLQLLRTTNRLLQDLELWLQMIPKHLQPGKPLAQMQDTGGLSRAQVIVLHSSYYYVLCSIYRRFTPIFTQERKSLEHMVDQKSHVSHIQAARRIALLTKHLDIESYTPAWLVFYYPFTALTTIFVHIVADPSNESTQSDIALMETVVGFFGRLEYVTDGETAFTKTTEFVQQARRMADRHGNGRCSGPKSLSPTSSNVCGSSVGSTRWPLQAGMDLEDDAPEKDAADLSGSFANDPARDHHIISSRMVGSMEAKRGGQRSESGDTHQEIGILDQEGAIYTDLMCLLEASPVDTHHSHWLGDWASAG